MAYPKKMGFEELREIDFAAITANYTAIGPSLTKPVRIVCFSNDTDQSLYISLDGVTDHIKLSAGSFFLLDISANKIRDEGWFISEGVVFYVKHAGVAPTLGDCNITVAIGV